MNAIPNLENKRFCIFGLQGSGKSYLSKRILATEPKHFVYDVMHEYQGFNRYLVNFRQFEAAAITELDTFVQRIIIDSGKIRLFLIDEANRYCPSKPHPLPGSIQQLNDWQRHFDIAFGSIARRPSQLHSDLPELAHYIFVFNLPGKNDQDYLNSVSTGLGEAAAELQPYHFILVDERRKWAIQEPV